MCDAEKDWHERSFRASGAIGQFRIPGGTGASGVKPTKVRLMRGRNESTRAVAIALNCTNKKQENI